jgi:hypothetical protein
MMDEAPGVLLFKVKQSKIDEVSFGIAFQYWN